MGPKSVHARIEGLFSVQQEGNMDPAGQMQPGHVGGGQGSSVRVRKVPSCGCFDGHDVLAVPEHQFLLQRPINHSRGVMNRGACSGFWIQGRNGCKVGPVRRVGAVGVVSPVLYSTLGAKVVGWAGRSLVLRSDTPTRTGAVHRYSSVQYGVSVPGSLSHNPQLARINRGRNN